MTAAPRRRQLGGFSMVEFLIAAFIFAIGLLGLVALQVSAVAQATAGRGRTTAALIAEQILQRAQVEGQYTYFAKSISQPPSVNFVPFFTSVPGTGLAEGTYGGFNVDGIQVTQLTVIPPATTSTLADVPNLSTVVPDPNKRNTVYTASWLRRAYQGTAPTTTTQSQEFVVNVAWVEGASNKFLSVSRTIRY